MSIHEVVVPDIGDSRDVEVAELLVAIGATVAVNDALMVLESDKASVEVTTTVAGVVRELAVRAGDKVTEAQVLARIEAVGAVAVAAAVVVRESAPVSVATSTPESVANKPAAAPAPAAPLAASVAQALEVVVPDLGDAKNVVVSEILVALGEAVKKGQALVVLEWRFGPSHQCSN